MRIQKFFTLLLSLLVVITTTGDVFWLSNQVDAATTVYLVDREDDPSSGMFNCNDSESDDNSCPLRFAIDQAFFATDNIIIRFDDDLDGISSTDNVVTLTNANGSGADDLDKIVREDVAVTIDGENHVTITHDGTGQYEYLFQLGTDSARSSNNVIKNLIMNDFANGIVIQGPNNTVQNVTMSGDASDCSNNGQRGISIIFEHIPQPQGNTILDNTISCFRKGIMAQLIGQTTISGNVIRNNNSENTDLEDGFSGAASFEDTHPCFTAGIEIQGSLSLIFGTNTISNNQIHLNGSEPSGSCTGNEFASAGIILDDFTFPAVFDTIPPLDDPNLGKEVHVSDMVISGNHLSENI